MGKKGRRQGDPGGAKEEVSDSSEDNKAVCPHAKKFKNKGQKSRKTTIVLLCKECKDKKVKAEENSEEASNLQDNTGEEDYMVCLFCAFVGCQEHAQAHQKTVFSDCHDFAFYPKKETIWCFLCPKEVQSASLVNAMKTLLKKVEIPSSNTNAASETEVKNLSECTPFLKKELCTTNKKQSSVKGLMNLGNTCFFNSVLQCLAQTPYLIPVLERLIEDGESCHIPGVDKVEPLEGKLSLIGKGALTIPLLRLLKKMRNRESNNVERPDELLQCLQKRFEQFKGREQHDAHELLRHLLEGVRADDLKRFQKVILKNFELWGKKEDEKPPDAILKLIRGYGFRANDLLLGPDVLFRGELISTLECQECYSTSTRTEHFLDLSLPVTEEKPTPPTRKKDADYSMGNKSKQQSKKERRERKQAQKLAKRQANQHKEEFSSQTQDPAASNDESDNSDADVEDNAEPDTSLAENRNDVVESGYSSEKAQNGDSAESVSPAESGCAEGELSLSMEGDPEDSLLPAMKTIIGCPNVTDIPVCNEVEPPLPFAVDEVESENGASSMNPDLNTSILPSINEIPASPTPSPSPNTISKESDEDVFDFTPQECDRIDATVNDDAEGDHDCDMRKCSPTEGGEGDGGAHSSLDINDLQKRLCSLKCAENGVSDGSTHSERSGPSKGVAKEPGCNSSAWTRTLAPRKEVSEGDCSVLSCLNQFTAVELMHTANKVGCDNCTKNKGKDGKTVLTNSTKQLLISSPPAVLIIQLKRFIADISRLKKMNRLVSFPMSLDLAPFCSVKCWDSGTVKSDQTEILYSLYGVVEHSGQMANGHYVAYVKVRQSLGDQDPRWNFLAPGREFLRTRPSKNEAGDSCETVSPTEQWYYISDSHVSLVDEEKVKRVQAYVLFYERVV